MWHNKLILLTLSMLISAEAIPDDVHPALTKVDYEAARKLGSANIFSLVKNASINPHWIDGGKRFWYRREGTRGPEIALITSATGERKLAYDINNMSSALTALAGENALGLAASPEKLITADNGLMAKFRLGLREVSCSTIHPVCDWTGKDNLPANMQASPDGARALFVKENNLWLYDVATREKTALTFDGQPLNAYAGGRDQDRLLNVRSGKAQATLPQNTYWSPDGRWVITKQRDERELAIYPFIESAPADGSFRPKVYNVRVELLGDKATPHSFIYVIDINTKQKIRIDVPEGFDFDGYPYSNQPIGWSKDNTKAYLYITNVDAKIGKLISVEVKTNKLHTILEEKAPDSLVYLSSSLVVPAAVQIIDDQIIWYSERTGWGHLYLYNLETGEMVRQLTQGKWPVHSLIHVDADRRTVLFARMGHGKDPYQRYISRVSLDGGDPVLLTSEVATHSVGSGSVSPDGRYFIDTYSTVSEPPKSVLRLTWNVNSNVLLEKADASALYKLGWRAPERHSVTAADGKTELYAVVFSPNVQFDAHNKLPIIDNNYMNSILSAAPVDFMSAVRSYQSSALSRLGFYVVAVDGRGTPFRSRAFREAGYPAFLDIQVEDHVAAIKQLAMKYTQMDIAAVGIYGHSNGGAGAARAILKRPDFYHVSVASAGNHDLMSLPPSGVKFFGVPEYAVSSATRPTPDAVPANYQSFDNAALAPNLSGHLMLAYGNLDTAALPAATLRLVKALTDAGKRFDLIYMSNQGHRYLHDPYFGWRLRSYFIEHLHGIDSPF